MFQSKRDANVARRLDPEVQRIHRFLEAGLQRAVEPGTLQTVLANTVERKTIKRVARAFKLQIVFWKTNDPTVKVNGFFNSGIYGKPGESAHIFTFTILLVGRYTPSA